MKYLFFDIECSVVSKNAAKICAFGYCLTDEKFNILEKEDLLINPQGGFHLTDRKGTQGLVLPYEYASFKKYPTFLERAEKIYGLLQDPDTLVVGHATMNDVKYLNLESNRFQLPSFAFSFADTQFLYMNSIGEFSRFVGMTALNGNCGIIAFGRADRPCDLIKRHALQNGSVKINDEMCADPIFVFKIFPVLKCGGSGVGDVMDNDFLQLVKLIARSRFFIDGKILFCDKLCYFFIGDIFVGNNTAGRWVQGLSLRCRLG